MARANYQLELAVKTAPSDPKGCRRLRMCLKHLLRVWDIRCRSVLPSSPKEPQK